ncbi:MAG: YbaB/EbfC family nucleoid-associated protein [Campylobacterales bacterium]|nr:YbaB/EbfC family nucleoid-associated protein [Campylobacterales bacterium]
MFDGFDMSKMGKMMEQMQEQANKLQEDIKSTRLKAKGGGGMIEIEADGAGEIIDITIDDSLLEDKESLQILLISTMNDVNKMVEDNKKSQAMGMLGGLGGLGAFK